MEHSIGDGDQEMTDSTPETEDHVSITGDDGEGTRSEEMDKRKEMKKIEGLEPENSTCKTEDEQQMLIQNEDSEDLPQRDKGKERARTEEREESRIENAQDCSFCTELIRESPVYVIQQSQITQVGRPVCSSCLRELQTTNTFQRYSSPMIQAGPSEVSLSLQHLTQFDSTITQSTLCLDYQRRPNSEGRKRVCRTLSSRREKWRARRRAVMGQTVRLPRTFSQDITERSSRNSQLGGIAQQGFAERIETGMESWNNRSRKRVSYTSKQREIRQLEMLLKRVRARLVRIRGQRAIVPVSHHTPTLNYSAPSSPYPSAPGVQTLRLRAELESESRRPPTFTSRPVYMGPPPSEAGPSNLNPIARRDTQWQIDFVPQSPTRVASPDNPFFSSPETCPSLTIWRDDDDDERMQE